ncbi:MAG: tRNA 4-thiouridine(8) synthase ThiI [Candidatus Omnitrophica bacterium]|nr:tRNA 4-thiouridine(8) synthase ThiI [Candidatus Omnitrophota bacterium]
MKAIVLFSGGLDSTLATKIILEQGIDVFVLNFLTPFWKGCRFITGEMSEKVNIEFRDVYLGEEYLEMLRRPKYGYGKSFNPCIDCRILMLKHAKKIMEEVGASFIVTGEVLGQRPMSQNLRALKTIEKEAGVEGLILRPLSAKVLPLSIPEKIGWVNREKMFSIVGRSRKIQMELAENFGIKDYPSPAGGCLLTDPGFSRRLNDLLEYGEMNLNEIELLKLGRHFRITPSFKLIVGRNEIENKKLLSLAKKGDICLEPKELKGPVAIGRGNAGEYEKELSAKIVARYVSPSGAGVKIGIGTIPEEKEDLIIVEAVGGGNGGVKSLRKECEIEKMRI